MTNFLPDMVFPPGETIAEFLEEKDWNQEEFATRTGFSTKHISQLMTGKATITVDTAQILERVLGSNAQFWLNLETNYRNHLSRIETHKHCEDWVSWLDVLPLKELKQNGVLPQTRLTSEVKASFVEHCLRFFGVANPEQWQAKYASMEIAFRRSKSVETDIGAVSTWLRLGEIKAESMDDRVKYNKEKFKKTLSEIRKLTIQKPENFSPHLKRLCAESGVALVFVPSIAKAKVSGAARWLNNHKPIIQLSLFGKTNDKFWFTFFHEAAHILLHSDKKDVVYLDNPNEGNSGQEYELEADQWASNMLIPEKFTGDLKYLKTRQSVIAFAKTLEIHPGIVVGRLQHEKIIEQSWLNDLKVSYVFA